MTHFYNRPWEARQPSDIYIIMFVFLAIMCYFELYHCYNIWMKESTQLKNANICSFGCSTLQYENNTLFEMCVKTCFNKFFPEYDL